MATTNYQVYPLLTEDNSYTEAEVAVRDSSGHKFETYYQPILTAGTNITISNNVISATYTYSLPVATTTTLGGVYLGSDTAQATAANTVTSTASRTYAVQRASGTTGGLVVNVPWTDTVVTPGNGALGFNLGTAAAATVTGFTANTNTSYTYVIPYAGSAVFGLVKLVSDTAMGTASNAAAATGTAGRVYPVQFNSSKQMVVNVPWTDTTYTVGTGALNITLGGSTSTLTGFNANSGNAVTYNIPSASDSTIGVVDMSEQYFAGMKSSPAWLSTSNTTTPSVIPTLGALYRGASIIAYYTNEAGTANYTTTFNYPHDADDTTTDTSHTLAVDIKLGTAVTISW
jgi:hypothetical protein